eukprot:TRINITY_DN856_c0_g1_i3.p2 TRINITY_DN856_c0_g1~~TRINITY_DN856_c0_g1_i3.p2  ORF type:complete len:135 (-),score=35.78 TRINITY_DN856_c0_g1_i3:181-585(-)
MADHDKMSHTSLCKRKKGLYQKAEELALLCGVQVAVIVVGDDGSEPAHMVATGHGNYNDLPTCFRVLNRYTEAVKISPLQTPEAALDATQTLQQQEDELNRQREEIAELKKQLAASRRTESDEEQEVVSKRRKV